MLQHPASVPQGGEAGAQAPQDVLQDDEIPPLPPWLTDQGEIRYDRGRLEVRNPGETIWREKVEDGQHVE
jgi:hypothetical protein